MFECIWAHDLCNQRQTYGARFERHGQITSGTPSVHPVYTQCLPLDLTQLGTRSPAVSPVQVTARAARVSRVGARKAPSDSFTSLLTQAKAARNKLCSSYFISFHIFKHLEITKIYKNYSEIFRVWYDICTTSLSDCICTTSLSDLVSGRWTCSSNLDQQNIGDGGKTRLESSMWNNGNGKQIVMPNNAKHGARGWQNQFFKLYHAVPCCTMHQDTRDKWGSKSFTTWVLSQNEVCCICSICSPRILSSALQPYSAVPHRTELWAEGRLRPGHSAQRPKKGCTKKGKSMEVDGSRVLSSWKNWALHVLPPWAESPAAAIASKCHEEYQLGMSTPCLKLKKQMHQNAQVNSLPPSETLETLWKLKTGAFTAQVVLIGGQPGQPWRILRCCDHRLSAFQSFHRFALTICKTAVKKKKKLVLGAKSGCPSLWYKQKLSSWAEAEQKLGSVQVPIVQDIPRSIWFLPASHCRRGTCSLFSKATL